jgi:class 3 adenylate cyclase
MSVDRFPQVSIMVCDVANFSLHAQSMRMENFVNYVKRLHSTFDNIVKAEGAFRVDVACEAYMVAAGHEDSDRNSADVLLRVAQAFIKAASTVPLLPSDVRGEPKYLSVRIGICTNSAHASVIGSRTPRYVFFGKAVMAATWLEIEAPPDCVHVCSRTRSILPDSSEYKDALTYTKSSKDATYLIKIGKWQSAADSPRITFNGFDRSPSIGTGASTDSPSASLSYTEDKAEAISYWRTMNLIQRAMSLSFESNAAESCVVPAEGPEKRVEALHLELANVMRAKDEIVTELEHCTADLQEKQRELEMYHEELEALRSHFCDGGSTSSVATTGKVRELQSQVANMERQIQDLTDKNDSLSGLQMHVQDLRTKSERVPELEKQIEELKAKNMALEVTTSRQNQSHHSSTKSLNISSPSFGAIVRANSISDHDDSTDEGKRRRMGKPSSSSDLSGSGMPALQPQPPSNLRGENGGLQTLSHQDLFGTVEILSIDDHLMNLMVSVHLFSVCVWF